MKNLINIKHYPSNFGVSYEENNERKFSILSHDGLKGILTREEWKEDDFIASFPEEDQEKILNNMNIYEIFA